MWAPGITHILFLDTRKPVKTKLRGWTILKEATINCCQNERAALSSRLKKELIPIYQPWEKVSPFRGTLSNRSGATTKTPLNQSQVPTFNYSHHCINNIEKISPAVHDLQIPLTKPSPNGPNRIGFFSPKWRSVGDLLSAPEVLKRVVPFFANAKKKPGKGVRKGFLGFCGFESSLSNLFKELKSFKKLFSKWCWAVLRCFETFRSDLRSVLHGLLGSGGSKRCHGNMHRSVKLHALSGHCARFIWGKLWDGSQII